MEIWKDIEGYEGLYQVSNLGRIKSCGRYVARGTGKTFVHEKIIAACENSHGYYNVPLSKAGKLTTHKLHRLVSSAFVPNPNNYPQVNHIDGRKSNNVPENFEWCTSLMNVRHAIETGLTDLDNMPARDLKVIHTPTGKIYNSIKEAAQDLGIHYKAAWNRLRRSSKKNTLKYL